MISSLQPNFLQCIDKLVNQFSSNVPNCIDQFKNLNFVDQQEDYIQSVIVQIVKALELHIQCGLNRIKYVLAEITPYRELFVDDQSLDSEVNHIVSKVIQLKAAQSRSFEEGR